MSDIERSIVGCCLANPDDVMPVVIGYSKDLLSWFQDHRYRSIIELCFDLFLDQEPCDPATVWIKSKGMEFRPDPSELSAMANDAPPPGAIESMLGELRDNWASRRIIGLGHTIVEMASSDATTEQMLSAAQKEVELLTAGSVGSGFRSMKELARRFIEVAEAYVRGEEPEQSIKTGLSDLDRITNGLLCQQMVVVAARPACGKTSLGINIAAHAAIHEGCPVGIFSLEMSDDALFKRMFSAQSRVPFEKIREGKHTESEHRRIAAAASQLANAPIYICDQGGLTTQQLRAKARLMQAKHGIRLWVIDYLQLLRHSDRSSNRNEEVARISGDLKLLAKETNAPVIALTQLNREIERDKPRRPRLSDLRESGAIEQDADVVIALWTTEDRDEIESRPDDIPVRVTADVLKQRDGPVGPVPLLFFRKITKFENQERTYETPSHQSQ